MDILSNVVFERDPQNGSLKNMFKQFENVLLEVLYRNLKVILDIGKHALYIFYAEGPTFLLAYYLFKVIYSLNEFYVSNIM